MARFLIKNWIIIKEVLDFSDLCVPQIKYALQCKKISLETTHTAHELKIYLNGNKQVNNFNIWIVYIAIFYYKLQNPNYSNVLSQVIGVTGLKFICDRL